MKRIFFLASITAGCLLLAACGGSGSEIDVDQAEIDSTLGIDDSINVELADTSAADSVKKMDLEAEKIPGEGEEVEALTVEDPTLIDEEVDYVDDPQAAAPDELVEDPAADVDEVDAGDFDFEESGE